MSSERISLDESDESDESAAGSRLRLPAERDAPRRDALQRSAEALPFAHAPVFTAIRWPAAGALFLVIVALVAGCSLGPSASTSTKSSGTTTPGANLGAPSTGTSVTPPANVSDLQQSVVAVVKAVEPAVVEVAATNSQGESIGAGEILTNDGYIVMNDHVVAGFSTYSAMLLDGTILPATLVGQAADDDLAVLKVNATNAPTITFADSSAVQAGEFAVAIGSPLGLEESATFGIVSALNRVASEGSGGPATIPLVGLIQTSAPINPGNSGGALVNLNGQLIGIPTLGASSPEGGAADGIGFAIPSNRITFVTQQLIQNGHLTHTGRAFLGVQGQDVTPQVASVNGLSVTSGVLVTGFSNDTAGQSPAQAAGIKVKDVIVGASGHPVPDNDTLIADLAALAPGASLPLTVQRGTQQVSLTVTVGERPLS